VEPIFGWLSKHGGQSWPQSLVELCDGLQVADPGVVRSVECDVEREVLPTPARLAWMLRNSHLLAPSDGSKFRSFQARLSDRAAVAAAADKLDAGYRSISRSYVLEGASHADCLIECEHAVIWVEGKRDDWLAPGTSWDVTRDQLARNLEAVWSLATAAGLDYCVIVAYEDTLKHHEQALIDGYRAGTWTAGWPHLSESQRQEFSHRIGTVRWREIVASWPAIAALAPLADLVNADGS
jgi:hypothetical protein